MLSLNDEYAANFKIFPMRHNGSCAYKEYLCFTKIQGPAVSLDSLLLLVVCHLITSRHRFRKCSQMLKESCPTLVLSIVPWRLWSREDPSNSTLDFQYIVLGLPLMWWYASLCSPNICSRYFMLVFNVCFASFFCLYRWLGFFSTKFRSWRRKSDCDCCKKDISSQAELY